MRFCHFVLLGFMMAVLIGGCDDENQPPPTQTEKPIIVINDAKTAEEAIVLETNAARAKHGKPPLKHDPRLRELARYYSQLMLEKNFFAHVTPDGKTLSNRFANFQIKYRAIAENLARFEGVFQTIPTREVVEGWLNSPGHRVNLLDEKNNGFTHIGLGIAVGKSPSSQTVYYYTQLFWLP